MSRLDAPQGSDAAEAEAGGGEGGPAAQAAAAAGHDARYSRPARGRQQYVYNMSVVRACPMYGFHPEERLFIKIML